MRVAVQSATLPAPAVEGGRRRHQCPQCRCVLGVHSPAPRWLAVRLSELLPNCCRHQWPDCRSAGHGFGRRQHYPVHRPWSHSRCQREPLTAESCPTMLLLVPLLRLQAPVLVARIKLLLPVAVPLVNSQSLAVYGSGQIHGRASRYLIIIMLCVRLCPLHLGGSNRCGSRHLLGPSRIITDTASQSPSPGLLSYAQGSVLPPGGGCEA